MLHVSCSSELVMRLDCQTLLKSSPPNITGWTRPWFQCDAVMSLQSTPLSADSERYETCERIVLLLRFVCVTITWQRIFKGSLQVTIYDS